MRKLSLLFFAMVLLIPVKTEATDHNAERATGFLGIYSEKVSQAKAQVLGFENVYGSYITRVLPDSPAEKAGLSIFDYIYGINNVETAKYKDLNDLLKQYDSGDEVDVQIVRKKRKKTLTLRLGSRLSSLFALDSGNAFLGVMDACNCPVDEIGLKVKVISNTTADALGMRDGDILTGINKFPICDMKDIQTALNNMNAGDYIILDYKRNGVTYTVDGNVGGNRSSQVFIQRSKPSSPAYMGIYSNTVSKDKARKLGFDNKYGNYISSIVPGSAAEAAGLQIFDYIYGIDEYRVGEGQTMSQILRKFRAGDNATIHFIRSGNKKRIAITFGRKIEYSAQSPDPCEDPFLGVQQNYRSFNDQGVQIAVVKNSTASFMGLKDGDIIIKINNYPIIDWDDLGVAIDHTKVGDPILIKYRRDNKVNEASQPIASRCQTQNKSENIGFKKEASPQNSDNLPGESISIITTDDTDNKTLILSLSNPNQSEIREFNNRTQRSLEIRDELHVEGLKFFIGDPDEKLVLAFNLPSRGDTDVVIYNKNGSRVYEYELDQFSGEFADNIKLPTNISGTYYLEIKQLRKSLIQKISIVKK